MTVANNASSHMNADRSEGGGGILADPRIHPASRAVSERNPCGVCGTNGTFGCEHQAAATVVPIPERTTVSGNFDKESYQENALRQSPPTVGRRGALRWGTYQFHKTCWHRMPAEFICSLDPDIRHRFVEYSNQSSSVTVLASMVRKGYLEKEHDGEGFEFTDFGRALHAGLKEWLDGTVHLDPALAG